MGISKTVWRCCGCGWSTEERQTPENVEVVPTIPPSRGEVRLRAPQVDGVPLILLPQCERPRFDRSEQVLLDRNGANDAFLNPERRDKVFAFVIEGETASQIADYLHNSPRFPRLTYFALMPEHSYLVRHHTLGLSEFFERHRDTLTFVDIQDTSTQLYDELERALDHLPHLSTLCVTDATNMRTLLRGTLTNLKCLNITFKQLSPVGFSVSAPNLEICHIDENRDYNDGTQTIDLRNSSRLEKVSFFAACKERKLILPERDSKLKWLEIKTYGKRYRGFIATSCFGSSLLLVHGRESTS